jgi:hypothetical protein
MQPRYPLRYVRKGSPLYATLMQADLPNFGPNGNLTGMRLNKGWADVRPVKCGAFVYNCNSRPEIYAEALAR